MTTFGLKMSASACDASLSFVFNFLRIKRLHIPNPAMIAACWLKMAAPACDVSSSFDPKHYPASVRRLELGTSITIVNKLSLVVI